MDNERNDYQHKIEERPSISVIVPAFNVKRYLPKVVESLRKQTMEDLELIFVDDASTDGTYEVLKQYEKKDRRMQIFRMECNRGVSAARNVGLSVASGKYIAFVDSDDWVETDMMNYLFCLAEDSDADISTCEISKEYLDGTCENKGSHLCYTKGYADVIDEIHYGGDFTPYLFDKLYRKELLDGIRFKEGISIGEDYRFLMEVMLRKPVVIRGGECKYHYQQLSGSVTHRGFEDKRFAYKNRMGHKETFLMLIEHEERFKDSATAYYILQEMAVVTSMAKSRNYDRAMIQSIRGEVRRNLVHYICIKRVPCYLKICAVLLSVHADLLIFPYRLLFRFMK